MTTKKKSVTEQWEYLISVAEECRDIAIQINERFKQWSTEHKLEMKQRRKEIIKKRKEFLKSIGLPPKDFSHFLR